MTDAQRLGTKRIKIRGLAAMPDEMQMVRSTIQFAAVFVLSDTCAKPDYDKINCHGFSSNTFGLDSQLALNSNFVPL